MTMQEILSVYFTINVVFTFAMYMLYDHKYVDYTVNVSGLMKEMAETTKPAVYVFMLFIGSAVLVSEVIRAITNHPKGYFRYKPKGI